MLWLCLHLPSLPLEIFTRHHVEPYYQNQGKGTVVVENNRIAYIDASAQAHGVHKQYDINRLKHSNSNIFVQERNTEKEQQALQELAEYLLQTVDTICLYPNNSLILNISHEVSDYQSLKNILHTLDLHIKSYGYNYQYGLAHTPKAAQLACDFYTNSNEYFDDITQSFNKKKFKHDLNILPVTAISHNRAVLNSCNKLAIETIKDLMELPLTTVEAVFGKVFLNHFAQLRGEIKDIPKAIQRPIFFARSLFFKQNIQHFGGLRFPIRRLLNEFCNETNAYKYQGHYIEWVLISDKQSPETIVIPLSDNHYTINMLFELSQQYLSTMSMTVPITGITLRSANLKIDRKDDTTNTSRHAYTQKTAYKTRGAFKVNNRTTPCQQLSLALGKTNHVSLNKPATRKHMPANSFINVG